ncbi:hypothetical protein LWP59_25690 [Amycolatopsis acidiphila]|uniref:Uncharacterized protein n=1 Tax=Amycolatopsis acidiphila TaxID=715473 RepID=A0A558AL21_9PSEU|nr:hypothetical protein [Amycolatopsis acidiphila]TVT24969.1 hypothetical protein FNH06_03865 [Amycolatopsis acidiphila]UIJ57527.1 hypothetical protein LWP59_25690 [Amycolatopsis acidiphila]GHG89290.1 hypothetical protein GCM10017788_63920 [Amycolatopsis acidiphila]
MASWAWPRSSYEATVLLVPLDDESTRDAVGLEGVRVFGPEDGEPGPAVHTADMVVLLTCDLSVVDTELVVAVCDAARMEGRLIGAVIVDPALGWHTDAARRAAVVVRESVDTVLVLREMSTARAFIDVLRGGDREALAGAR